jgi:predicted ATPase
MVGARLGRLGREAVARLATLVHRRAGGHPLHTTALLDVLVALPDEAAATAAVTEVPQRLRAVLDQQIDRLDRPTRRSLEALAVLRPVPLDALATVLDRSALAVADDLRAAPELRLVVAENDRSETRADGPHKTAELDDAGLPHDALRGEPPGRRGSSSSGMPVSICHPHTNHRDRDNQYSDEM